MNPKKKNTPPPLTAADLWSFMRQKLNCFNYFRSLRSQSILIQILREIEPTHATKWLTLQRSTLSMILIFYTHPLPAPLTKSTPPPKAKSWTRHCFNSIRTSKPYFHLGEVNRFLYFAVDLLYLPRCVIVINIWCVMIIIIKSFTKGILFCTIRSSQRRVSEISWM